MVVFRALCEWSHFLKTPIILLFTKVDVLKTKILERPVSDHFPDFSPKDGKSIEEVKSYFREKFLSLNPHPNMSIMTLFTSAFDKGDPAEMIISALVELRLGRER